MPVGEIFQSIATVLVALIGLAGIWVQTKSHTKIQKQESLLATVDEKIDKFRQESKSEDDKLSEKMDDIEMQNCKRFLIVEMTKIKDQAYIPNEEQKRMLKETKERYNARGGDSYIDDMYEDLRDKKLI